MQTHTVAAVFSALLSWVAIPGVSLAQSMTSDEGAMPDNLTGTASYYSEMAHGERTASGEIFDKNALVAAHPFLPFGTVVQVSDMATGRSIKVRVIDRGPSESLYKQGVIIILSPAAAQQLGFINKGTAQVRLEIEESGG